MEPGCGIDLKASKDVKHFKLNFTEMCLEFASFIMSVKLIVIIDSIRQSPEAKKIKGTL